MAFRLHGPRAYQGLAGHAPQAITSLEGQKMGTTSKLAGKKDGRVGLFLTNGNLDVNRIEIRSLIDKTKL